MSEEEEKGFIEERSLRVIQGDPDAVRGTKPPKTLKLKHQREDTVVFLAKKFLKDQNIPKTPSLINAVSDVVDYISEAYDLNNLGDENAKKRIFSHLNDIINEVKLYGLNYYPDGDIPSRVYAAAMINATRRDFDEQNYTPKGVSKHAKNFATSSAKIYHNFGTKLRESSPDKRLSTLCVLLGDLRHDLEHLLNKLDIISGHFDKTPMIETAGENHTMAEDAKREFGRPILAFNNEATIERLDKEHSEITAIHTVNTSYTTTYDSHDDGYDDEEQEDLVIESIAHIGILRDRYLYLYAPIGKRLSPGDDTTVENMEAPNEQEIEAVILDYLREMSDVLYHIGREYGQYEVPGLIPVDNINDLHGTMREDPIKQGVSKKERGKTSSKISSHMIVPEGEHDHILFE